MRFTLPTSTKIMLSGLALGFALNTTSCSPSDDGGDDPQSNNNGNNNGNNNNDPGNNNGNQNAARFYENTVDKVYDLEGIYINQGSDTHIETDNPTVRNMPKSGTDFFSNHLGLDPLTTVFITITGQKTNDEKDVFELHNQTNFGYNAITLAFSLTGESSISPNARYIPQSDVTYSTISGQAQDVNGQNIFTITGGSFRLETLNNSDVLGYQANDDGSQGVPVQTVTYVSKPKTGSSATETFLRNEDGVVTVKIQDNANNQVDDIIALFNEARDIYVFETIDGNPASTVDGNDLTPAIDARTFRHYDLGN